MDDTIRAVQAYEILDSRGTPTLAVRVTLADGHTGVAKVPSGASTGAHEAVELRDGGARYGGKGVRTAKRHVEEVLGPAVVGRPAHDQAGIDRVLVETDGDPQKGKLGANAILGVSLAVSHAAAAARDLPLYRYWGGSRAATLPVPQLNVINGGAHADNNLDVQEFMLVPWGAPTFAEAIRMAVETYQALKARLKAQGLRTAVGDEGGFAPDLTDDRAALDLLMAAIADAGLKPGEEMALAVDVAASELYRDGQYRLSGRTLSAAALIDVYASWVDAYPIVSLEDGLAEDDWDAWPELTRRLGSRIQLVGDDLLVTNPARIERAIAAKAANAALIKLNQIGTVSETFRAIQLAQEAGWRAVVSHRSGETDDASIADLAVAANAGQIKTGAPARGERVAKYNRLLMMAEDDPTLAYAGRAAFRR
jgi:enolase